MTPLGEGAAPVHTIARLSAAEFGDSIDDLAALLVDALAAGADLLLLDTETGSTAEHVYLTGGWTRYGIVPDYAGSPDGTLQDCSFFYKRLSDPGLRRPGRAAGACGRL